MKRLRFGLPGMALPLAGLLALFALPAGARKILVGMGGDYAMPMDAAPDARDGDTVEIAAGTYSGEAATWRADNLVLRGNSKYARLEAPASVCPGVRGHAPVQGDLDPGAHEA